MKRILPALLLSMSVLTVSCGNSDDDDKNTGATEGSLNGTAYIVTDGAGLQRTATDLSGSGTVLFKNPLGEIGSKDDFLLQFKIDDGGRLDLLTHTDSSGKAGVSAVITREGGTLSVAWAADGTTSEKTVLEGVNAADEIKLAIDIHNDETPSHILVWNGSGDSFSEEGALTNSEEDVASPGKGSGTYWGLTLSKVTVLSANVQAPKFVEE